MLARFGFGEEPDRHNSLPDGARWTAAGRELVPMPYVECPGCRLSLYSAASHPWLGELDRAASADAARELRLAI